MKQFVLILILVSTSSLWSQENKVIEYGLGDTSKVVLEDIGTGTSYEDSKSLLYRYQSPGLELIKASKHYYIGNTIILGGVVTSGLGALNVLNDNDMNTAFIIGGGVLSLVGLVFIVESHIHIKRAGILLNENGVGVKLYL